MINNLKYPVGKSNGYNQPNYIAPKFKIFETASCDFPQPRSWLILVLCAPVAKTINRRHLLPLREVITATYHRVFLNQFILIDWWRLFAEICQLPIHIGGIAIDA